MINFLNATFIKSCPNRNEKPQAQKPEVLIVGRSNVGKSSLINALTQKKKLAFTSSKPGHTRLLNYYDIDNKFYLVDAPGYGYAKGGIDLDRLFAEMMSSYFDNNTDLKLVLILLDARRELSEDISMVSIRAYILMSGLLDDSESETLRAVNNVLKAYKRTSKNLKSILPIGP